MLMTDSNGDAGNSPLRVLLVQQPSDRNGSTISGELVARGFREAGWDVDVAFGSNGDGVELYENLGCTLHIVPHKNWLRGGNVVQSLRRIGHELRSSGAFTRLIQDRRPDVVYANTIVSLAAAVAARRRGLPFIWHIRELFDDVGGEMRIPPLAGRALVRLVIRSCADHVVLISQAVRDNILGPGWDGDASIVANAVDERFFELDEPRARCREQFGLPADAMIVGVPGTLRPMKGHEFFFKAAAQVVAEGRSCRIAVTGEGEPAYSEHLRQLAGELGLSSCVRFLGTVKSMPEFYRACDLVCIPSRAEPFGRTVIEAFASRTPVVATSVGGIRETVQGGRTGLLVEYGDIPGLCRSLSLLLSDAELRFRLADAALQEARLRYSTRAYYEQINRIVKEVVTGRERPTQQ
jgi:glycosyltransferase involved in cell wall biosynthesis